MNNNISIKWLKKLFNSTQYVWNRNILDSVIDIVIILFVIYVCYSYFVLGIFSVGYGIVLVLITIRQAFKNLKTKNSIKHLQLENSELQEVNRRLDKDSKIDYLTGLYNRRYILELYNNIVKTSCFNDFDISVIMLDIDHFKLVNDQYGHISGDQVLKKISEVIKLSVRDSDYVGRFGGEEFIVLLPDADIKVAKSICERIRLKINFSPIYLKKLEQNISVTVSGGVASSDKNHRDILNIINKADRALYNAKNAGRNCVSVIE